MDWLNKFLHYDIEDRCIIGINSLLIVRINLIVL